MRLWNFVLSADADMKRNPQVHNFRRLFVYVINTIAKFSVKQKRSEKNILFYVQTMIQNLRIREVDFEGRSATQ